MATSIIAGSGIIISIEYASDGLSWARLYDSLLLGWYVDHEPPWTPLPPVERVPTVAPGEPPVPAIIGHLIALAPPTMPVLSPQWAQYIEPNVFVPDLWRGTAPEFFTWLATNNGVHRPLGSCLLVDPSLQMAYSQWAHANPELSFVGEAPL